MFKPLKLSVVLIHQHVPNYQQCYHCPDAWIIPDDELCVSPSTPLAQIAVPDVPAVEGSLVFGPHDLPQRYQRAEVLNYVLERRLVTITG